MTNPKGAGRERWWVEKLEEHGHEAQRAPNHAPSRDVDHVFPGFKIFYEVKDRQNLNAHKLVKQMLSYRPKAFVALVSHRVSKGDRKRSVPDGPTLVEVPTEQWLDLMDVLRVVFREAQRDAASDDIYDSPLADVVVHLVNKYPQSQFLFDPNTGEEVE